MIFPVIIFACFNFLPTISCINRNSNYIDQVKSIFSQTKQDSPLSRGELFVPLILNGNNGTTTPSANLEIIELVETIHDEDALAKNCLENMTSCMEKYYEYEDTTKFFGNYLTSTIPPLDLSKVHGISTKCRTHSKIFMNDLAKFKFWALKMYDSSAKIPSGLLNGNVNQLGDFDLCLQANNENDDIYGQYCLASFQIEAPDSPYLGALYRLLHSHLHFKSRMNDPGHRVPRFSSINWAICVPDGCTAQDVHLALKQTIGKVTGKTNLKIRSEVQESMCQTARPRKIQFSSILAIILFSTFILFLIFATFYDFIALKNPNELIIAFSLKKNVNSLIEIKKTDDIKAVHGIRFLNSILLVLSHKSMAVFFFPYHNRTEMVEFIAKPWTVLARAASLYTDPFIMIAGTLTAHSFFGKLQRNNKINIKEEYTNRLFRIVPSFAVLIAFCTFILPLINSGPMWNQVVTHHAEICKQNWWRNLLFIHNYFGFGQMCLTHTHHIGIDTQLFFISPFLILLLWKYPKEGLGVLISLAVGSTILRYYVTYTMRLSNYIHFGTSIKQLFDTADNMYILPIHRITVYIMGILLGYYLRRMKSYRLSKLQIRIGNSAAFLSLLISFLGPSFMGSIKYVYNPVDAAWYAAFAPIFWCIAFGWIIFSVHLNYESMIGKIFSLPIFSLWTKISYSVYLTQFPIFFYNVGTTKAAESYSFWRSNIDLYEVLVIIVVSIILTLTVEMPFQNIRNLVLKKEKSKSNADKKESIEIHHKIT